MFSARAVTFVNAMLPGVPSPTTLRVYASRIAAIGEPPHRSDEQLDCDGDWLLPGLINAHDHLELNNFGRLKWHERYTNVRDWIADFEPRFKYHPALTGPMSVPLADRLFISGLKNLLSGVTTVAHHNPLHPLLKRPDYPVRVVQRYGWSHSLLLDGEAQVQSSFRRTPAGRPWIIHLAEGVDAEAAQELTRLDALGCLRANTVIVHGVGLTPADRALLLARGAGLIWCPSSNLFMLGATAEITELAAHGRVALGTDSRLSGERDLLDELRAAHAATGMSANALLPLVTTNAARLLRLPDLGVRRPGALADLLILPAGPTPLEPSPAADLSRTSVRLVMRAGRVLYADPCYASAFTATGVTARPISVDGCEKLLQRTHYDRLRACSIQEPGVTAEGLGESSALP